MQHFNSHIYISQCIHNHFYLFCALVRQFGEEVEQILKNPDFKKMLKGVANSIDTFADSSLVGQYCLF